MITETIGIWIAAFLTLAIFSFLYKDNPIYKFTEQLFVGVSAGYWLAYEWQNVLLPNLYYKVFPNTGEKPEYLLIIPGLLGIFFLLRLVPKIGWISRWAVAFAVGTTAGMVVYGQMSGIILAQVHHTMVNLFVAGNWASTINNCLLFLGVFCGLIYFYFSKSHDKGFFKAASRIGIYFLMIAFGAGFGYTVMARISVLIGRFEFLLRDWLHLIH